MQNLPYARVPEVEAVAPLAPGSYRGAAGRTVLFTVLGLVMTLASVWIIVLGLDGNLRRVSGPTAVAVGIAGTLFFGVCTAILPLQALIVTATGVRSRLPLPGAARVAFADVRAVVVYPRVSTRAGTTLIVILLGADGHPLFRLGSPPYPLTIIDGFASRVHRASGAPVYACGQVVPDTAFTRRLHLPNLV